MLKRLTEIDVIDRLGPRRLVLRIVALHLAKVLGETMI
jgi:hypothetical protein